MFICNNFFNFFLSIILVFINSCIYQNNKSVLSTADISNTSIKEQSIDNCWIYMAMAWVEASHLRATKNTIDLSETYLTYRYFQKQLLNNSNMSQMFISGTWAFATELIREYGIMREGDFIPSEAGKAKSIVQANALTYINNSLKSGILKTDKSYVTIKKELNKAFSVNIDEVQKMIIDINKFIVAINTATTQKITLATELSNLSEFMFNSSNALTLKENELPKGPIELSKNNKILIKKFKMALNRGYPVMISWFVDLNAYSNGIFSMKNFKQVNKYNMENYHLSIVEDYVASGIDPKTFKSFKTSEGKISLEEMMLAEEYGDIDYIVIKNSWGDNPEATKISYKHDNKLGFTRINSDYLFGALKLFDEKGKYVKPEVGLHTVILPKYFH